VIGAYRADFGRCVDQDTLHRRFPALLLDNYGLQALLGYRLGRALLRARYRVYLWPLLPLGWGLYFLLSRYARVVLDIRLELSADIGPGLYIGHFGAIRVRRCRIGSNCSIGRLTDITPATARGPGPVIGDRVWIGAHVRIVGAHYIGSGATIAAGAEVRTDLLESALCIGNPARVMMCRYDNRRILGFTEEFSRQDAKVA
jgi:serine O-acetyltransferase